MASPQTYLLLRHAHLGAVSLSLALFAARGAGVALAQRWPMRPAVRWASVLIDTVLLACGIGLWTLLGLNPLRDAWLGVKLAAVVAYIVLGSLALKRAPVGAWRLASLAAALACAAFIVSIARAHHGAGWWHA